MAKLFFEVPIPKKVVFLQDWSPQQISGRLKHENQEYVSHETIAKKLKTKFFFTHPYSAWEKGLIENTNKLIRQYIPKKTDFRDINNLQIKEIQYKLNNRPRQNLNFYSPKETFFLYLQNKVAFSS